MFGLRFEDSVSLYGLNFATSALTTHLTDRLLFAVAHHLLTVILILPGGQGEVL